MFDVSLVEQPDVNDNLARLPSWFGLKSYTKPAVRFAALFKTARRDRVGENEKCFLRANFCVEAFNEKILFVV